MYRIIVYNYLMGEAKLKKAKLELFRSKHPFCCFCGGTTPTESIDHVPARIIFLLKRRPPGLEFPACRECNENAGPHELVAALLARATAGNEMGELEGEELRKIYRDVDRNRHGILEELWPSWQQQYDFENLNYPDKPIEGGVFNAASPMLNQSIQLFSAKMCLALHYEHSQIIVPPTGGVVIRWYSNVDALENKIPNELFNLFDFSKTLSQGKWTVESQFGYSFAFAGNMSAYFCYFSKAFAFAGFIHHDRTIFKDERFLIHVPGQIFNTKSGVQHSNVVEII